MSKAKMTAYPILISIQSFVKFRILDPKIQTKRAFLRFGSEKYIKANDFFRKLNTNIKIHARLQIPPFFSSHGINYDIITDKVAKSLL